MRTLGDVVREQQLAFLVGQEFMRLQLTRFWPISVSTRPRRAGASLGLLRRGFFFAVRVGGVLFLKVIVVAAGPAVVVGGMVGFQIAAGSRAKALPFGCFFGIMYHRWPPWAGAVPHNGGTDLK